VSCPPNNGGHFAFCWFGRWWEKLCDPLFHNVARLEEDSLTVAFERTNAFKHRVKGYRLNRVGVDHPIEWIITFKALKCTRKFWDAMMADWQTLPRRKG